MSEDYREIRDAIANFETDRARDLIREELKTSPTAEVYYLAAQVAVNDYQRRKFLTQALEIDPFHTKADRALKSLDGDDPFASESASSPSFSSSPPASNVPYGEKPKRDYTTSGAYGAESYTSYPLADFFTRSVAYFIDIILLAIVGFVFGIFVGIIMPADTVEATIRAQNFSSAVGIVINIAYHVYFLTQNDGQTPGKAAMNIKIVKKNGEPLTVTDAFLRNIVGYILSSLILFIGFLWALGDSESQTWHDKIVNTVVIRAN